MTSDVDGNHTTEGGVVSGKFACYRVEQDISGSSGYAGMDIGHDNGGVVDRHYANRASFAFTGTIRKVTFDIKPHLTSEDEQALHESAHHGHVAHGING